MIQEFRDLAIVAKTDFEELLSSLNRYCTSLKKINLRNIVDVFGNT